MLFRSVETYDDLVTQQQTFGQKPFCFKGPWPFVTEKTWKPIACGQLFLVIGNPGTIQVLEESGVDAFSDIIDHKYYDSELDWKTRIHKVHSIIDDLTQQDLFKINQETYQRRKRNAERFRSGEFDKTYYQDITSYIDNMS